jgi:hypothetical protein
VTPIADHGGGDDRCAKANDDVTHACGYGEFTGKTAHRKEDQEDDAFGTVQLQADDPLLRYCLNETPEGTPPYEDQDTDRDGGEDSVLDSRNSRGREVIEPGACREHGGNVKDCKRGSGGEECFAATRSGPVGPIQGAVEAKE